MNFYEPYYLKILSEKELNHSYVDVSKRGWLVSFGDV